MSNTKKVFISYVRQDSKFVDKLVALLEINGLSVWLDRNDLEPGQPWEFAIRNAIQDGWKFISVHSKRRLAREKTQANTELGIAINEFQKMPIDSGWLIPIRIDDSDVPDRPIGGGMKYLDLQICDFRSFARGAKKLLAVLGVENPIGVDHDSVIKPRHFNAPLGTWHAALEALTEWQKLHGEQAITRSQVAAFCPDRTLTDLTALGLINKTDFRHYRLSHEMADVRLALSVAIAQIPMFSVAADLLRNDFRTPGAEIGAAIADLISLEWSSASMTRNGSAYKRWTLALFPNFGGPKPGEADYLIFEAMRAKQLGHGRNTVLTEDVKRDVGRWKSQGMKIKDMATRLGIAPNILHNFKRYFREEWDSL